MKWKMAKNTLGNFYSPYDSGTECTMNDWYEAYQSDLENFLVINGIFYSKIIDRSEICLYAAPTLLMSFESIGALRVDDCGHGGWLFKMQSMMISVIIYLIQRNFMQ